MSITINTGYNKGFSWIHCGDLAFIGYLINSKSLVPSEQEILSLFSSVKDFNSFRNTLSKLNGTFSVIIRDNNNLYAATDPTRFFPLFYSVSKTGDFYISDDIHYIVRKIGSKNLNLLAVDEFLSAAHTCNNRTLYNEVCQIRPGEALICDSKTVRTEYYYHYSSTKKEQLLNNTEILRTKLISIFDSVFETFLSPLRDQKIALALSGGYDSRLIACMLRKYGVKNVICFTYGRNNIEVNISKHVAERLGYKWYFIEYTHELIKDFSYDQIFNKYYEYASRGTSMFYLQEYPALRFLIDNKIIDDNYIALPGHSGGLLRGARLVKNYPVEIDLKHAPGLLFKLRHIHGKLTKEIKQIIRKDIKKHIDELAYKDGLLPYSVLEDWELKEHTSKYIFNSSHAFTFFGLKTYFPLADKRLLDFFRLVPAEYRMYGKLFYNVVRETYFKPFRVDIGEELKPKPIDILKVKIKARLRPILPLSVKYYFLKKNDWPFYGPMTQYLLNELHSRKIYPKSNGSSYLYRILNWYLMKISKG